MHRVIILTEWSAKDVNGSKLWIGLRNLLYWLGKYHRPMSVLEDFLFTSGYSELRLKKKHSMHINLRKSTVLHEI